MTTADIKQDVAMTYSSALDIAKVIDDKRLDFNGMCDTLDNLIDDLNGQWQGTAQYEFMTAYGKLKPKLKLISSVMEQYSKEIRAVVSAQQEQDTTSAKQIGRIKDWFLPAAGGIKQTDHVSKKETEGRAQKDYRENNAKDNTSTDKDQTIIDSAHILSYAENERGLIAQKGRITYVDQYDQSDGWGERWGDHSWECCTACQSMALSYLGISRTPEQLLKTGATHDNGGGSAVRGTPEATQDFHWGWDQNSFNTQMNLFLQDDNCGKTSPVLIHYRYYPYDGNSLVSCILRMHETRYTSPL